MLKCCPVRQESPPVDMGAVDISGFHPPWHSLPDFQLREDMHHFVPPPPPQVEFFSNGRISGSILYSYLERKKKWCKR